jgi:hypothetical protein
MEASTNLSRPDHSRKYSGQNFKKSLIYQSILRKIPENKKKTKNQARGKDASKAT